MMKTPPPFICRSSDQISQWTHQVLIDEALWEELLEKVMEDDLYKLSAVVIFMTMTRWCGYVQMFKHRIEKARDVGFP